MNLAILAALLGCLVSGPGGQPAAAAPSVAIDVADAPSGIPGFTRGQLERDAWETYNGLGLEDMDSGSVAIVPSYGGSHIGAGQPLPAEWLRLESAGQPGVFHMFRYVPAWHA